MNRLPAITRLGPLEQAVMDFLWRSSSASDVSDVHREVGEPRGLARNTIGSTLERLVRKDLVLRSRRGRAYEYCASGSRATWVSEVFDSALADLGVAARLDLLAGFVDFADRASDSTLRDLEALVQERLAARGRARSDSEHEEDL